MAAAGIRQNPRGKIAADANALFYLSLPVRCQYAARSLSSDGQVLFFLVLRYALSSSDPNGLATADRTCPSLRLRTTVRCYRKDRAAVPV